MKPATAESLPPSSKSPQNLGFSFQEDLWFGDFDDDAARHAAASSMAAMAGRVMGARPFPAAAQRLVQLTRNEDTNIHKVVRVLESDPGLSQRVLRLVNSAGYGLRVRCTSLNHATALLGQQRLQQIATSAVLLNHFGRTSDETKRKQEHGALVASLCRYLAIHLGLPQEDLFTCGLLHDLGQLMMLDEGDSEYRELVNAHEEQWDALHISEREIMGFDHAVLAAHVLASWSIPAPVPEVIALHHQPALAHHRGPKIAAMVQTLRFADHMAHLLDKKKEAEGAKILADSEAASYLGFSEMQIAAMWKDLRQLHEANRSRRMDIQDVAPRSVSVPPSLSPRAVPFTESPQAYSEPPYSPTDPVPSFSEGPPATMSSLGPSPMEEEPVPSVRVSTAPLSLRSEQEVLRLTEATPIARAESAGERDALLEQAGLPPISEEEERPSDIGASPEVFPCALCYGPTFGAQCPVCAAHVCSAHQTTERQWCLACDDEFHRYTEEHRVGRIAIISVSSAIGVAVLSSALLGGVESGLGVLGICLASTLAAYAGYQGYLKQRFKKERAPVEAAPPTLFTPSYVDLNQPSAATPRERQEAVINHSDADPLAHSAPPIKSAGDVPAQPAVRFRESEQEEDAPATPSNLLSLGPMNEGDSPSPERQNAVTVPAPSITRARERELEREESLRASASHSSNTYSWPPSQEAPAESARTSFLPRAEAPEPPLMSLSEPPPEMRDEPVANDFEAPHPAIAPPSMGNETIPSEEHFAAQEDEDEPDHGAPESATLSSQPGRPEDTPAQQSPDEAFSIAPVASPEVTAVPPEASASISDPTPPANVPPQLRSEPPTCQPAMSGSVSITPPVIRRRSEFCSAPAGTVRILPLTMHSPSDAPPPENDQSSHRASGEV